MFAKVFASLWDGTLADQWETWSVFVFMLAHCDAQGVIDMTPQAISRRSCIPVDKVEAALQHLSAPDPRSRTATEDGRRIVLLDDHRDWGWRIVNYEHYRNMRDEESRREQNREATRRWRGSKRDGEQPVSIGEQSVSSGEHRVSTVSIGEHPSASVSHGEPKQKQKQKQREKKKEPAGSTLFAELEAEIDTSDARPVFTRLVKYLQDTGTSDPGCILAVLRHFKQNRDRIDKPLAYYDRSGPARSAIIMQHNMAIAERQQAEYRRSTA